MEEKSNFITVLAWIFIVGAGFASLISIMQVIMVNLMFPSSETEMFSEHMPGTARFIFQHFNMFIYLFSFLSITTFVSAIGLLKRKNWARLMFMGIMLIGIFWMLAGIVIQFSMFNDFPVDKPGDAHDHFQAMINTMRGFNLAISIGISAVFAWIIRKLMSQRIIQEFT